MTESKQAMTARLTIENEFVRMNAGWREYWRTYVSTLIVSAASLVPEVTLGLPSHPAKYFFASLLVVLVAIQDVRAAISARFKLLIERQESASHSPSSCA